MQHDYNIIVKGIDTNIEVIVVSFPGRYWDHNDRNWHINFYSIVMKLN